MGLETGTFIADLVPSNPLNSDLEGQGAAHLRLIKTVLQNTIARGSRATALPTTSIKTATYTAVSADVNTIFLVDTTAALVNFTLPTLLATDAGWEISIIKTNAGLNPILIKPPSGTLQSGALTGLAATRRCIPGTPSRCIWTGSAFIITRAVQGPVGGCIEFHGAALPVGFELPNGQTLVSANTNYPDYFAVIGSGVTLDRTGRVAAMKEAVATRLTSGVSGVDGATIGSAGGLQTLNAAIARNQLPNLAFTADMTPVTASTSSAFITTYTPSTTGMSHTYSGGDLGIPQNTTPTIVTGTFTPTLSGNPSIIVGGSGNSLNGGVTQQNLNAPDVQPTIVTNLLLVVE